MPAKKPTEDPIEEPVPAVEVTQVPTDEGSHDGPEERRSQGAANLAEAMEQSDKLAKEQAEGEVSEAEAEAEAARAENEQAIAEAGAELEARDDEVYGREPADETATAEGETE